VSEDRFDHALAAIASAQEGWKGALERAERAEAQVAGLIEERDRARAAADGIVDDICDLIARSGSRSQIDQAQALRATWRGRPWTSATPSSEPRSET
jgi:hypothetical protein